MRTAGFLVRCRRMTSRASPGAEHCERLLGLVPRATSCYSSVGVAQPERTGLLRRHRARPRPADGAVDVSRRRLVPARSERSAASCSASSARDPLSGMQALLAQPRRRTAGASSARGGVRRDRRRRSSPRRSALHDSPTRHHLRAPRPPRHDRGARAGDRRPVGRRLPRAAAGQDRAHGTPGNGGGGGPGRRADDPGLRARGRQCARRGLFVAAGRTSASVFADPNDDLRRFLCSRSRPRCSALAPQLPGDEAAARALDAPPSWSPRAASAPATSPRAPRSRAGSASSPTWRNALNAAAEDIERRQAAQARLLAELVAAEEETRRRIAADIHDDTAQAVAAAGLRMDALVGGARRTRRRARRR